MDNIILDCFFLTHGVDFWDLFAPSDR